MNTLLISPETFLAEGGIARIMRLYLKALCEVAGPAERVDSLVLNDLPGIDPRLPRYSDQHLGEHVGCSRSKRRFIREAIRLGRRADNIICGHLHHLPIAQLVAWLNPRCKYYLVAHGIEVWRPYNWFERRAMLGAHRILCVSEYTRHQMLRFHPRLDPARLVVVPNTLDPYVGQHQQVVPSATPFAQPRVLCVSRLLSTDTYKGVDTLIEAMPVVRKNLPLARLRIIGTGDDQPRLHALTARLNITHAVDFLGAVSDETLRAEYAACDFFALPSRKEGFGLVYLEAMTYGKACIGAHAGGAPEVINDKVGTLVDYGNIPELAAAIGDLASRPRDSEVVRRHAASFDFPTFKQNLVAALALT